MFLFLIAGIFTIIDASPSFEKVNETIVVQTSLGSIRGTRIQSYDNREGYVFFGVPFAESADGERRFALPVPRRPWNGIRDGTKEGMACPANPMQTFKVEDWSRMDDDCLHNIIFTSRKCLTEDGCAVLFAIHGGIFEFGSPVTFDVNVTVHNFAANGQDVVVVLTAYRLGGLGFLNIAPGRRDLSTESNLAIHDILLSMKWVQQEISAFGGDPKRVTLFGHSAGSVLSQQISLSNSFVGLYSQLVVMSVATSTSELSPETNVLESWLLADYLCCSNNETDRMDMQSIEEVLVCMREKTWKEVIEARKLLYTNPEQAFRPSADGPGGLFPDTLPNMAQRRPVVPTLIGTTTAEYFISKYALDNKRKVIMSRLEEMCSALAYGNNYTDPETASRTCIDYYKEGDRVRTLYQDIGFFSSTCETATSIVEKGSPLYLYSYAYNSTKNAITNYYKHEDDEHPAHQEDYMYLFGNKRGNMTAKDYAIENIYAAIFVNFVKTGNPHPGGDQPEWSAFNTEKHEYYLIDFPDDTNIVPGPRTLYQHDAVNFWNTVVPKVAGSVRPLTVFPRHFDRYLPTEVMDIYSVYYTRTFASSLGVTLEANDRMYYAWTEFVNEQRTRYLNNTSKFSSLDNDVEEVSLISTVNINLVELLMLCFSVICVLIVLRSCIRFAGEYRQRKEYIPLI